MNTIIETYFLSVLINLLTANWKDLGAHKKGFIDGKGQILVKGSLTLLERFAFNLRRIIEKLPGGKSKLTKYVLSYSLLHEEETKNFTETINSNFLKEINNLSFEKNFNGKNS